MSSQSSKLIIAGFAGVATALGVAFATIQSQSPENPRSPQPSNPPTLSSPVPNPAVDRSPVAIAPTDNPESPAAESPTSPKPQPVVVSPPPTSKPEPVVVSPPTTPKPQPKPIVVSPPESGCKISMALVSDPNPPLNVRDRPQLIESKIVGTLNNNSFVSVTDEQNGWLQITDPVAGWIAKNRTKSSCPNVKQRISFVAGGSEAIVQGQIIGGGSHSYLINASKGQRMTLTNYKQFFPFILTPDGKLLAQPRELEGKTEWTGTIPVTGDYTLQLDSNFKGYEYNFSVELK